MLRSFNIRVYGILINEAGQVLVSDERIRNADQAVTKFPGGGLELGEGTIDCLRRECMEEMGIRVAVTGHLYTTDYFQPSAFNDTHQLISIYYRIKALEPFEAPLNNHTPCFPDTCTEAFRFIDWDYFHEDVMSLPVDKIVARILKGFDARL
jgi:8-oxo-dGTP diphosphatase